MTVCVGGVCINVVECGVDLKGYMFFFLLFMYFLVLGVGREGEFGVF